MSNLNNQTIQEDLYDKVNAYEDHVFDFMGVMIDKDPEAAEFLVNLLEGRLNRLKEKYGK